MKKESVLQIIEARIKDLDILLDSASRNPAMKEKAEMWQFAVNELILVRDTIADISDSTESEV